MKLRNAFDRIPIYLSYYLQADTKYSLHSPYLAEFIDFVFDQDRLYYDFNTIQTTSELILRNNQRIPEEDYSVQHLQQHLTISQLYKRTGHPLSGYETMFRLALYLNPNHILELGGGTGLGSVSLALGAKSALFTSVEGNRQLADWSNQLFKSFQLFNAHCELTSFDSFLSGYSAAPFDLVFLDGDHSYDATKANLKRILELTTDSAVIVLDDIHWSYGMYSIWNEISHHPSVQCSLETARWGILFKNKALTKEQFVYIDWKYKPWKWGLFS